MGRPQQTGVSQKTCKTIEAMPACFRGKSDVGCKHVIRTDFMDIFDDLRMTKMKSLCTFLSRGLLGVLFLGLTAIEANAQTHTTPADTITGKVHQIGRVTVTARRPQHRVGSLAPVQSFSAEEMSALGLVDVADALRHMAGANVKDYGGMGGLKTVSVRNLGAAHTAVSYDGVTVSNTQAGQIDLSRFSLDNVSLVSLSIGQSDDLLQSARHYASAGVVTIESEKPHFEDGKTWALRTQLRGGSYGFLAPALRWWQQIGSRTQLAVNANYQRADGNYPFTLENGKTVTTERRINSDMQSYQGEVSLWHHFSDSCRLEAKGYYYRSERGLPGAIVLYNPTSHERLWDENAFGQLRYTHHLSRRWSLQAQTKYNYSWNRYQDEGGQYGKQIYREHNRQNEFYASATALYRPWRTLSLSLAQDVAVNSLRSDLKECPQPTRTTYITALNARFRLSRFTANASLLHTETKEKVKTGTPRDNFSRWAPTLGLSFKPMSEEDLYLRLMYKSTFRLPTFNDLYYYRMGNQNLRPEKAHEYNVGITWSHNPLGPLDYLSMTVDGYYNDVTDKIVAVPTTYAWKMYNYGKVHTTGLDLSLSMATVPWQGFRLSVGGSYTWQKTIDLTNPEAKNYEHQVPYTPAHSGSLSAQLTTPWVEVGYSLLGMSKRYYLPQNLPENEIEGYVEQTLTLSREFKWRRCRLKLQAECVNLADKQYDVIKYYPMPGRQWRGTLTLWL